MSNTNSPFEKYKAKQTSDEKSMSHNSNELLRAGNNEELWKKLFFISLSILLVVSIILIFFTPIIRDNKIKTVMFILIYGIVAFTLFSLLMLLKFHLDYINLCNKTLPSKTTTNNTSLNKSSINYVLEGKYKSQKITNGGDMLLLDGGLTKRYISSYTVIDESNKDQYSFWKGALGVALFGGIGAVAGINGKNKKEYLIAIEWKDGEKSLILINDEYYKVFVKSMF